MATVTITKKEYGILLKRQEKIEEELDIMKKAFLIESDEGKIYPSVLKRWEKISRGLDYGKGRSFASAKDMKKWLKSL